MDGASAHAHGVDHRHAAGRDVVAVAHAAGILASILLAEVEAGLFVIAAAQVGAHADGRRTYGHSLVIDPWGEVLLDMREHAGVGFAIVDPQRIAEVRSRLPALRHRRPIPDAVTL